MDFRRTGRKPLVTAKIYIEGGGDSKALRARFREGWKFFFAASGLSGRLPRVVRGGSRQHTYDRFATDVAEPASGIVPLLLVDSEDPVAGRPVWRHLQDRDGWNRPAAAGDDQAFLMVQVMETWFLADRGALQNYFGARFKANAIKPWPKLEDVPKATVFDALEKATAQCSKPYAKGRVSFDLLAQVDPIRVEAVCSHAKALLNRLRAL